MREISLLRQLVNHEQFVRLLDILEDDQGTTKNIHCIFEFCEKVLANELNKRDKALPEDKARRIIKDLLVAVDVLHGKMIMHRDIKPDNILIDSSGRLKLADFGLAKKASFLQRRKSNAIVSLWYRAPEIILGSEDYFLGVDMWSVGCIFAELMAKRPIFMCRNENEVLSRVFQLLGTPSDKHCSMYLSLPKWKKGMWVDQAPPGQLRQYFTDASPQAMDLL
jgi:serine/threonine protein kinase